MNLLQRPSPNQDDRGGAGVDTFYTGAAADTFTYTSVSDSTPTSYDVINNFRTNTDKIDLSAVVNGGQLVLSHFAGDTFIYFDQGGPTGYLGEIVTVGSVAAQDLITTGNPLVYVYGDSEATETLDGSAGHQIITAGSGTDTIIGGAGDALYDGAGPDSFVIRSLSASPLGNYETIVGFKPGMDKLDVSAADGGQVSIVHAGADTFVYFDAGGPSGYLGLVEVVGNLNGADLITSSGALIYAYGDSSPTETLDGSTGHEIITAGSGTDTLIGGAGDVFYAGTGVDTFVIQTVSQSPVANYDVIDGFISGTDKLNISAVDAGHVEITYLGGASFIDFAPNGSGGFSGVVEVSSLITGADLQISTAAAANGLVIEGNVSEAATATETR